MLLDNTPKEQNNSTYSEISLEKSIKDCSRILVLADTDEYSITATIAPNIPPGIISSLISGITPTVSSSMPPSMVDVMNNSE